ncbi:MAG: hypothetical protein A3208_02275 [Candidatus Methanoprimaticola hominis]|nr:MAG: hypothetical protein A3208_02275 [Methanomassiliicoccales archaeon Mx-06]
MAVLVLLLGAGLGLDLPVLCDRGLRVGLVSVSAGDVSLAFLCGLPYYLEVPAIGVVSERPAVVDPVLVLGPVGPEAHVLRTLVLLQTEHRIDPAFQIVPAGRAAVEFELDPVLSTGLDQGLLGIVRLGGYGDPASQGILRISTVCGLVEVLCDLDEEPISVQLTRLRRRFDDHNKTDRLFDGRTAANGDAYLGLSCGKGLYRNRIPIIRSDNPDDAGVIGRPLDQLRAVSLDFRSNRRSTVGVTAAIQLFKCIGDSYLQVVILPGRTGFEIYSEGMTDIDRIDRQWPCIEPLGADLVLDNPYSAHPVDLGDHTRIGNLIIDTPGFQGGLQSIQGS